ncbi:MAG: MBOAT family protein [Myxococcales bacterium]|nr:MBOAT family protein [Myxococcales bacterium]
MEFNSITYLLFLLGTLAAFFALPRGARMALLVAASLAFYGAWSVPLTGLIVVSAIVDYAAARAIDGAGTRLRRRLWLVLSLTVNLGLLGFFKYAGFMRENLAWLLGWPPAGEALEVVLPPGISFYTFQTMSYTIDVYRGALRPSRSFVKFLLYVSFFPQLVAGPIERAGHLLTQFDHAVRQRCSPENLAIGGRMIVWGIFKKVCLADTCARLVDPVYSAPGAFDGWTLLVATYAFTLQIYFDFSAYSEVARGSARLFGVDLMRNFDQPYLSRNISEFWRRWHISLSTWFRDYVYLPLGGSRGGKWLTLRNLVITMFLSGLWHGAAWNFVLWGLYNGLLLLLHALLRGTAGVRGLMRGLGGLGPTLSVLFTFHLVVLGWVLFRVEATGDVGVFLAGFAEALTTAPSPGQLGFVVGVGGFLLASAVERRTRLLQRIGADAGLAAAFFGLLLVLVALLSRSGGPAFIYFQF